MVEKKGNILKKENFNQSEKNNIPLYATKAYVKSLNDPDIVSFEDSSFSIHLVLQNGEAYGFKYSPIGASVGIKGSSYMDFEQFEKKMMEQLRKRGVSRVTLRQPPGYYPASIPDEWFTRSGYTNTLTEIDQYIDLVNYADHQLHAMEQKKLRKLQSPGILMTKDPIGHLKEIHDFIRECRDQAGLTINISFDQLNHLFTHFPDHYTAFSLREHNAILCAVIMVQPVADIAYYYLPATHPDHKRKSPMVMLLHEVITYFQSRGVKIMDCGISSIGGVKQEGLFKFKERMGAQPTGSLLFEKRIT